MGKSFRLCVYAILMSLLAFASCTDPLYQSNLHKWHCGLNYKTPRDYNKQHTFSFGFCFKDPSIFCFQHAVTMNGCKAYNNMGLYCCIMENVNEQYFISRKYNVTEVHTWLTRERFLAMTSHFERSTIMYKFLVMDIGLANITTKEELAAFLSIIFLDTTFLINMEEHLPMDVAKNVTKNGKKDEVKFIGRGVIHVAGRKFYKWINSRLNKLVQKENNHNQTLINAVGAPEVLLFPTSAFRTGAFIWGESYSYVQQKSMGNLYKKSSDGSLDNMAKILYHLKGNLDQLPALVNIWKRVRKVLSCPGPIKVKEERKGNLNCRYESLCRGLVNDTKTNACGGSPKKILCADYLKDLLIVLIFDPKFPKKQYESRISKFVSSIFSDPQRKSKIKIAFSIQDGSLVLSPACSSASELWESFGILPNSVPSKFPTMIKETVETLKRNIRKRKHHNTRYIVALISEKIAILSDETLKEIDSAENEDISVYSLFTRHDGQFYTVANNHSLSVQSRQLNLNQDDIAERMSNDPSFISRNRTTFVHLKRSEKRSYVIKLRDYITENMKRGKQCDIMLYIKNIKGSMKHIEVGKMNWPLPFDGDVMYNTRYSVRKSLQISDTHARFEGGQFAVRLKYSLSQRIYSYRPASYEVYIRFGGEEDENLVELSLLEGRRYVIEMRKSESTMKEIPTPLKVSCIFSICLLALLLFVFVRHSWALATKVTEKFRRLSGQPEDCTYRTKDSGCRWCYRRLSDDKAYWMLYNRDNGTVDTEYIRRNSFLAEPSKTDKTLDKCMVCRNRLDFMFVSSIHFLRILMLIIWEIIIMTTIYGVDRERTCKFCSGLLTFVVQVIILLSATEILYYCGWREFAKNKKWWTVMLGFSFIFSFVTEFTREDHGSNCWPLSNDIHGNIALAWVVILALGFFAISVYYLLNNGKRCSTISSYSLMLISLMVLLLIMFLLLNEILDHSQQFYIVVSFAMLNGCTMLLAFIFTLAIQAKAQNWFIDRVNKKLSLDANPLLTNNVKARQEEFDKALNEAAQKENIDKGNFTLTDCNGKSTQQSIKTFSVIPRTTANRPRAYTSAPTASAINSFSLPNYTIKSVLCNSNSSVCNEPELDADNGFEIIVRKRPRSASALAYNSSKYLDTPSPNERMQTKSADLYLHNELHQDDKDTFTFVTRTPPVIQIHHSSDTE